MAVLCTFRLAAISEVFPIVYTTAQFVFDNLITKNAQKITQPMCKVVFMI